MYQQNHKNLLSISVSGKALLFGEYGVMRGGTAVVAMLPAYRMGLRFSFNTVAQAKPVHRFVSSFFPTPLELSQHDLETALKNTPETEQRNFACYLSGFREFLNEQEVDAEVSCSFEPSLGFGTSSALLSCFQIALAEHFFSRQGLAQLEIENYWQRLYDALLKLQGRASGYDVAVQTWAALSCPEKSSPSVLKFRNKSFAPQTRLTRFEPEISDVLIDKKHMQLLGCFVETGICSNTRAVLKNTKHAALPSAFFEAQSEFAAEFQSDPSVVVASRLCREASVWARRVGLLPRHPEIERFAFECDRNDIPWKTMGAGHGDCLWVMASRSVVDSIIRKISSSALKVRYAFEDEQ